MSMPLVRVAFCGLAVSSALRTTRRGKAQEDCANVTSEARVVGSPGIVEDVHTFGAPGPGSPGLQNTRTSSPCFKGRRVWHTKGWYADVVAYVCNPVSYWHAMMQGQEIKVDSLDEEFISPCSEDLTKLPDAGFSSVDLHSPRLYAQTFEMMYPEMSDLSYFATRASYQDPATLAGNAKRRGWGLVGSAFENDADDIIGGPQWSHLVQNPSTLECVVTFQGTSSANDWLNNLAIQAQPFCGLSLPGEECWSFFGTCSTKKTRGSFAHWGFRDKLEGMVMTEEWQKNIRAHLPSCSKVHVGGHSAGGAMAELFAACVANAPSKGEFGYEEDYKYMGWITGTAKRLNYK